MSLTTKYNEIFAKLQSLIKPVLDKRGKIEENIIDKQNEIIETYNEYIQFAQTNYEDFAEENKSLIISHIHSYRGKLFHIFLLWEIDFKFQPELFSKIDENCFQQTQNSLENLEQTETPANMAITAEDFLRAAAQQLPKTYNGDPLGLQAFLKSIKLLKTLAGATHIDLLKDFIMTRLDSKASESVPPEPESIDQIIDCLKKSIKPDSSKVVAGKMMALKADKSSKHDFAKQAEQLAEDFKRSLVIEGISLSKATEMTTDKTVELCRSNAKSDLVKSILASTTFENPKEVVAKFIIESANQQSEAQIFSLKSNQKFYKKRGDNRRGRYQNGRYNNRGRYSDNRYQNNNNNNNRQGRGRGRGYYNRGNSRYQNNNNQNIRFMENEEAPQVQRNLGDSN